MLILVVLAVIYWNYRLNLQVKKQVDEIRKKDNLIMEQARFYSIGQTVGNIAHQWKAPLTYIGTIATTMEVTLKHKGKDQYLEISENSLEKISKYVQQLKFTLDDFLNYYTTKPIKADFYVYETIEENVLNLLRNKVILKNVSITYNFDKEYKINSYEHILANIFMVLFNNSLDIFKQVFIEATDDFGCLVIDTKTKSKVLEDKVFWYKAKEVKDFHMGNSKFKEFHKDNYDPNYIKKIPLFNINTGKKNNTNVQVTKIKN
jgi:signal transduction histidine kinase